MPDTHQIYEQDVDRWVRELEAAGWRQWRGRWDTWLSPWGSLYRGPYQAWRIMRGHCQVSDAVTPHARTPRG